MPASELVAWGWVSKGEPLLCLTPSTQRLELMKYITYNKHTETI